MTEDLETTSVIYASASETTLQTYLDQVQLSANGPYQIFAIDNLDLLRKSEMQSVLHEITARLAKLTRAIRKLKTNATQSQVYLWIT